MKAVAKALYRAALISALTVGLAAVEPSPLEINRLAQSLDDLVRQGPSRGSELIINGRRQPAVEPVELQRILPVAAEMLKVEQNDLRQALEGDRHRLSDVVYARLLGAKRGQAWRPLLINGEDLLIALQNEGVSLKQIEAVMDNLYTELAFASLDSPVKKKKAAR